jgi:hypothetical protein
MIVTTGNVHLLETRRSRDGVTDVTSQRDSHRVFQLTTFLRSLGHRGSLANVQAVIDDRAREEWLVEGLTHRLEVAADLGHARHDARVA